MIISCSSNTELYEFYPVETVMQICKKQKTLKNEEESKSVFFYCINSG